MATKGSGMIRVAAIAGMAWASSIGVAVYAGWHMAQPVRSTAPVRRSMPGESVAAAEAQAVPTWPERTGGVDAEQLRQIVREEVRREGAASPPAADPAQRTRTVESEPPTKEEATRLARANDVIDRAIARRQWTAEDRSQWFEMMREAPTPRLIDLQRRVLVAMNRGELSLEPGAAPPFMPPRSKP